MAAFSVQVETKPDAEEPVVVKVTGPTNVSNISILLMQLLAAFRQSDDIVLDLHGVTEIDAAGLQLFCSSHQSSIFMNKEFRITGQDNPVIWEVAAAIGHLRTSGCVIDSKNTCIWTGGKQ
jgi:anti-anti-sigma regulatory factor